MRVLIAFLLLLVSSGCQQATTPRELDPSLSPGRPATMLSTDRTGYAPGSLAVIRLRNTTAGPLGYNLCHAALERSTAGGWRRVDEDRVCTQELRLLQSGGSATYEHRLPASLQAGEYRYRTQVEHQGAHRTEEVFSNSFAIAR